MDLALGVERVDQHADDVVRPRREHLQHGARQHDRRAPGGGERQERCGGENGAKAADHGGVLLGARFSSSWSIDDEHIQMAKT